MLLPTPTDTPSGNVLSSSTSPWAQAPSALVALNDGAEGRSLGRETVISAGDATAFQTMANSH